MTTQHIDYLSLVAPAQKQGFKVTCPWDATYQTDMEIWNLRLQTGPAMIAYCMQTADVQLCVNWCRDNNFPFRVRSGGHHHEGMSCAYGALIIDLSGINTIGFVGNSFEQAWISPGKQLQYVYQELGSVGKVIPGGGCETVCVGGLTLGGGWGFSARIYGLTCDSLQEVEIVTADGAALTANETEHCDLFWALRGGGSGSYGIVTKMLFKLSPATCYTNFSLKWDDCAEFILVLERWLAEVAADSAPKEVTTACRLYYDELGQVRFSLGGLIYGTEAAARAYVAPFIKIATPNSQTFAPYPPTKSEAGTEHHAVHCHDSKHHQSDSDCSMVPPDTCQTGPYPHKVSSAFARNEFIPKMAEALLEFMTHHSIKSSRAGLYVSLHSFGGEISKKPSDYNAFPWRDRKLLLQYQAWWKNPYDFCTDEYIQWIEKFRNFVGGKKLSEGGFFNFQDASVADNKYNLLKYYLGDHLDKLIVIKGIYDPGDFFRFPMSIPAPCIG